MRAQECFSSKNVAAATYGPYAVEGGYYQLANHATWGGGNAVLQQLMPDGVTWFTISASITADGVAYFYLPPGQYQIVITTATGSSFALTRVPLE